MLCHSIETDYVLLEIKNIYINEVLSVLMSAAGLHNLNNAYTRTGKIKLVSDYIINVMQLCIFNMTNELKGKLTIDNKLCSDCSL